MEPDINNKKKEITPGDLVVLPSGGLPMTVLSVDQLGQAELIWHDTSGRMHTDFLKLKFLVLAETDTVYQLKKEAEIANLSASIVHAQQMLTKSVEKKSNIVRANMKPGFSRNR